VARPTKSVNLIKKNLTKEQREQRTEGEENLRGSKDKLKPPTYLNLKQKKIFKFIVSQLEKSGILGNLDIYILTTCSIAIDRLQVIEEMINGDINKITDKQLLSAKDKYTKDLYRCCNELSLSPQSRAKLANINVQKQEEDPLLKVLGSGAFENDS